VAKKPERPRSERVANERVGSVVESKCAEVEGVEEGGRERCMHSRVI